MISKDSDFFIYKIPVILILILLNSLMYDNNFVIKYKLYTRNIVLNYFHLTDKTLPIFATLYGNDYLKIENYPEMKEFIMYYNRNHRPRYFTNSIKFFAYKNTVNIILDMKSLPNYDTNCSESITSEGITPLQKTIIENIYAHIPKEIGANENFKNNLIESVRQYNIPSTTINNNDINIYININDSALKTKVNEFSSDILKSFYSGNFYFRLLNGKKNININ